jgi:hypothetical protein
VKEYMVVFAGTSPALAERVQRTLAKGWTLVGGVAVIQSEFGYEFYQALAK